MYTLDMPVEILLLIVRKSTSFPVNIIEKRDGMVYISEIQAGALYEGDTVRLF